MLNTDKEKKMFQNSDMCFRFIMTYNHVQRRKITLVSRVHQTLTFTVWRKIIFVIQGLHLLE